MAERNDKYNLILDSLQKLLESRGLPTISVSDIAEEAGIAKGSIYYYFPSKDAILEALVERNYEPGFPAGHPSLHPHGHDLPGMPQFLGRLYEIRPGKQRGRPGKSAAPPEIHEPSHQ